MIEARKFTIDEYHQMADAGLFAEDERIELIEGTIYAMTPVGRRHAATVAKLGDLFSASKVRDEAIVWIQSPLRLPPHGEPEPDLVLLKRTPDYYETRAPEPEDVFLLVEVADSSLPFDRAVKLPVYASAGIVECWLVNLIDDQIEVYREPVGRRYQTRSSVPFGQAVSPLQFPEVAITL